MRCDRCGRHWDPTGVPNCGCDETEQDARAAVLDAEGCLPCAGFPAEEGRTLCRHHADERALTRRDVARDLRRWRKSASEFRAEALSELRAEARKLARVARVSA
jgi:hypothetical protein